MNYVYSRESVCDLKTDLTVTIFDHAPSTLLTPVKTSSFAPERVQTSQQLSITTARGSNDK